MPTPQAERSWDVVWDASLIDTYILLGFLQAMNMSIIRELLTGKIAFKFHNSGKLYKESQLIMIN